MYRFLVCLACTTGLVSTGLVSTGLVSTGLVSTRAAAAQTAENQNAARAHFQQGTARMQADEYKAAIAEFEQSLELMPNAGTHMNLGVCHEHLGDFVAARRHYRAAERMAEEGEDAEIARDAAEAAQVLEQDKLARLIIRVTQAELSELEITLDGERVDPADLGTYIYVAPGEQRIAASADRCAPYETTKVLGKGEEAVAEIPALACIPEPTDEPKPASKPATPRNSRRLIGYGAVGVGGAALLGSMILGLSANSARNDAFDSGACNRDTLQCTVDGQTRMDTAHHRALQANIMAGAGVLVAGAGVVLWLTAPKQRKARESSALVPLVSPNHMGVALSGRF